MLNRLLAKSIFKKQAIKRLLASRNCSAYSKLAPADSRGSRDVETRACSTIKQECGSFLPSLASLNIMADPENQPEQPKAAPEKQIIGKN